MPRTFPTLPSSESDILSSRPSWRPLIRWIFGSTRNVTFMPVVSQTQAFGRNKSRDAFIYHKQVLHCLERMCKHTAMPGVMAIMHMIFRPLSTERIHVHVFHGLKPFTYWPLQVSRGSDTDLRSVRELPNAHCISISTAHAKSQLKNERYLQTC